MLHRRPRQAVQNPSLLLYFDGFENGRHVASAPLARRFPDDACGSATACASGSTPTTPSILQLQFEEEEELVQYLRCDDAIVIHLVTAALEGRWINASTDAAQDAVLRARELMDSGEFASARDLLLRVVEDEDPEYAYAWAKLGLAEFRTGSCRATVLLLLAVMVHETRPFELLTSVLCWLGLFVQVTQRMRCDTTRRHWRRTRCSWTRSLDSARAPRSCGVGTSLTVRPFG